MTTNQDENIIALPCGCRLCGCLCSEHSPDRTDRLCAAHVDRAVFRFIAGEATTLMAIGLFVAMILVWAAIAQS
jgi:hypothetical protein